MVIISNRIDDILVRLPNNLEKVDSPVLHMKNMESKKEYDIQVEDSGESGLYYIFSHIFSDIPVGEYEYEIAGNRGLLRIEDRMEKKVYDEEISFKVYEA